MARSFGTVLMDSLIHEKRTPPCSEVTTRKFDKEHFEKTGEIKYLEGEEITMQNPTENEKRMKKEITTLERFEEIGSYQAVAKKYKIESLVAHAHMMHLKAEQKKDVDVDKTSPEVTEGVLLPLDNGGVGDCAKEEKEWREKTCTETKADLAGLVEPEPVWTTEAIGRLRNDLNKLETEEDDEELLVEIGDWLKGIRERTIKRAAVKFDERISAMMGGLSKCNLD